MQVLRTLAGYSLGRADIVRRAMSKKKRDIMERERDVFINGAVDEQGNVTVEGCLRRGVDRKTAEDIFNEMESFASYAFNKSHAAAYATVSYKTAWLKCYYPREYMAALLSSVLDNQNKLATYISDCRHLGIEVLPPSVNESEVGFAVSGGNIRYGLLAIKNLGRAFIQQIITERKSDPFSSFYDFCRRMHGRNMNARAIESLIKCGAFDSLGANRRQLLTVYKNVIDGLDRDSRVNLNGQMSFFDLEGDSDSRSSLEPVLPDVPEFSREELLKMENDIAGMYFSGHPADDYSTFAKLIHADRIGAILNNDDNKYSDSSNVTVVCVIDKRKIQITKTNKTMAFVTAEDRYGAIEIVVFPNVYEQSNRFLNEGSVILVRGTLNFKENEEPKIICNSIEKPRTNEECKNSGNNFQHRKSPERNAAQNSNSKLYIRIDRLQSQLYERARRILDIFDGNTPVVFYETETKKSMQAPRSLWVSINDVMLRELAFQLGEENVVLK